MQANITETGSGPSGTDAKRKMKKTMKKLTRMSNHMFPQTSTKNTRTKTYARLDLLACWWNQWCGMA